jgi:hypothetical protein
VITLGLILVAAGPLGAGERPQYAHQEYFEHYEGTQTCLECHQEEAEAFFHSQHYQWQGEAPAIVNADRQRLGKMNTLNDFCTNPQPSWIGNVHNPDGKVLAQGCSKCHAGLGKLPSAALSQEQLENIDCLICHASGYRRDLYQDDAGNWEWRPILWKNQVGLDSVSKRITLPKRPMCLRCHAGAGGGPNFKRGDIEYALADCEPDFDVHMAKTGNDLECIACHAGEDHRIRGRGADLAGTDLPSQPLTCATSECHGEAPHAAKVLNHHTSKVSCTVCHIPFFAKEDATDMARDWSRPIYKEEMKKYAPTLTMEKNVQPVYAWYNGETQLQKMGEPIRRRSDGTVGIMIPMGERKDADSRIHAFKLHRGKLPFLTDKEWLIPIAVDEFFADGDIEKAVEEAAHVVYGIENPVYDWIDTVRYMGIFHEVQPAAKALRCLDCHGPEGRLDWQDLGYKRDPLDDHLK